MLSGLDDFLFGQKINKQNDSLDTTDYYSDINVHHLQTQNRTEKYKAGP